MTKLLYTIGDVAEQLSVSPRTVHRLLTSGQLAYVRQGRRRKVRHHALMEYIDSLDSRAEARRRQRDALPHAG